jgi:Isocitrate lyase family
MQVRGGLKAIYCSGWQVAGDANSAGDVYPDQSLYPANSVPELVRKLNKVRATLYRCCRCMRAVVYRLEWGCGFSVAGQLAVLPFQQLCGFRQASELYPARGLHRLSMAHKAADAAVPYQSTAHPAAASTSKCSATCGF